MTPKKDLRWRRIVAIAGVGAMIALAACSGAPKSTAPAPPPANIEELKAAVAAILKKYEVPGVGIALVTKDQVVWAGGVGKADLGTGRDVTADTMFRVGSITKGFVALSALQLAEHGKLTLDEKVADVAPEIPVVNPWAATNPVTLAQLLEHTAGFNDFSLAEFYDFNTSPDNPRPLLWTLTHFTGPEHVRWKPGSRMSYSNPGYGLAGYIVEKAAGVPLEDYVAANILRPLGMTHSDMRLTPAVKDALAQGYDRGSPVPYYPIYLRPAGEMKSSPNEMARFVRMMLNRGELDGVRIVSPESIARMETPETSLAARAGLKDGYGLGNYADEEEALTQHGHDGGIDGFLSRYVYIPEAGTGYFFSINNFSMSSETGPIYALKQLLYAYMTRDVKAQREPATKLPPGKSEWIGYYELASPRQEKLRYLDLLLSGQFVSIKNGALQVRPVLGPPRALIPVGGNQFRTDQSEEATAIFTTDGKDKVVMVMTMPPAIPLPEYFVKTDPIWPMTRLVLVLAAVALMLSSIVFALIWIPRKILGSEVEHLAIRILPLLATVSLIAGFAMALTSAPVYLEREGVVSLTYFIGTIAFAIFSVIGLALALGTWRSQIHRGVRIHSFLVAMACVGLTSYLTYWGQVGVRLWQPW
jgi:CubicO group peptidase (beta-lactamase class C family)